jgi:hypothetical protein
MALITKPDISKIWASAGAVASPPDAKIATGWSYEMMPFEWENYLQNRTDQTLNHISQRGIAEWDATTEYQAGRSYVTGSNGVVYTAVTTNTNINPTTDGGTNWVRAFASTSGGGATGTWSISISGSAPTLTTARTIGMTGDVSWTSPAFDGSANVTAVATLANSGVVAGTYNNLAYQLRPMTIDSKGRVTSVGAALTISPFWANITGKPNSLAGFGITDGVAKDTATGGAFIPAGDTSQRPVDPDAGTFRFNTTVGRAEMYNGALWGSLGGATGGGSDAAFYLNDQTINSNYTIPSGQNAMTTGPITIADGVTVTVSDGSVWTVI